MQTDFQNHSLKQLSNKELLAQTKLLVQKERHLHIQVLHHLKEIDSRKLYFEMGFSSLFDYAVRELGYSEGAAYRRIKAMKLCQNFPETESRLQSGRLSLSAACQLQTFFERQAKRARDKEKVSIQASEKIESKNQSLPLTEQSEETLNKENDSFESDLKNQNFHKNFRDSNKNLFTENLKDDRKPSGLSLSEKKDLISKVEGCSTRATMKLLSEVDPSLSLHREQTRFLGKGKVEIKMVIDESCHKKLEELKNLLSHKNPILSYGELLSILSDEALRKHDPRKKKIRQNNSKIQTDLKEKQDCKKGLVKQLITSAEKLVVSKGEKVTSAEKLVVSKGEEATSAQKLVNLTDKKNHKPKKINRTIPSYLKKYIWERDGGQCTYINHSTKQRCSSRHFLQIDHIQPFSLGGGSESENLRLLCAGHNRFRSKEVSREKNCKIIQKLFKK